LEDIRDTEPTTSEKQKMRNGARSVREKIAIQGVV
jgi:hypothetical protein